MTEKWKPPELTPDVPFCTTEQLNDVARVYAREMQRRGFEIGQPEIDAIVRMAAIQDVWRVAFARVLREHHE